MLHLSVWVENYYFLLEIESMYKNCMVKLVHDDDLISYIVFFLQ